MSREVNHAALSWTACFNDSCQTHKSDKDATGWYPSEPRQLNLATRNEEVLEIDDLIDDLPYDDELVNSDTGELYDSTPESSEAGSTEQWQDQAMLSRIMEHLSQYGDTRRVEPSLTPMITWTPAPRMNLPTQQYQMDNGKLSSRFYQDNQWYPWREAPIHTAEEIAAWLRDEARGAQQEEDRQHLRNMARTLCRYGTATRHKDTLHWVPRGKYNMPIFQYRVKENQIHWRRRIRRGQWTQWKNATFSLEEWDGYISQELTKARVPYVFPANEDIQPVTPATYGIHNAPRDLRHTSSKN